MSMNLFDLQARIRLDDEEYTNGINTARDGIKGLTSFAIAKGQIIADALKKAGETLIGVGKQAVEGYADYEQLVGGVDTLFKDSSIKVQNYAKEAYKNAGLSANEYMETVTGFSASLIQSLGGDTDKAAEKANLAIQDMSDNANKMGSDMGSIQNAYAGFAKGNMTMLDNLKLGYGGTNEEMERLLRDAEKISGIKYDISSYADIVDAIHVIQTEMDITGTTAKEAATTIQGSMDSAKAAFQNLMTGIADGNSDIKTLEKKFTKSIKTAAKNLLPVVKTGAKQMVQVIGDLAPDIAREISKLAGGIIKNLITNAPKLIDTVLDIADNMVSGFMAAFGYIRDGESEVEKSMYHLTEAEQEVADKAAEAMESIEKLDEEYNSNASTIEGETQRTQDLWHELQNLADENGIVQDKDKDRVDFILGELNDALGTEYERNGKIIGQYKDMQTEIEKLIQKKEVEALLDAGRPAYIEKMQSKEGLADSVFDKKRQIEQDTATLEAAYADAASKLGESATNYLESINIDINNLDMFDDSAVENVINKLNAYKDSIFWSDPEEAQKIQDFVAALQDMQGGYDDLANTISEYEAEEEKLRNVETETYNFEQAQMLAARGNFEQARKYLLETNSARWDAVKEAGKISAEDKEILKTDLQDKVAYAEWYKEQMDNNVPGFTEAAWYQILADVKEYHTIWENAAGESFYLGANIVQGIQDGIDSKAPHLLNQVGVMAHKVNSAMGEVWQIASPSKVMIKYGEYIAEGLAIGMENGTSNVMKVAGDMSYSAMGEIGTATTQQTTNNTHSIGEINLYIDGSNVNNVEQLADLVAERINQNLMGRSAAYGI